MSRARKCFALALCCAAVLLLLGAALMPVLQRPRPTVTRYTASGRAFALPELNLPKGTVDVNSADLYELTELYGVGESLAQSILDEREAHGPFYLPEDLLAVRGIGVKKLAGFRETLDFD